jgi:Zn-dependent peptidase ImmA (M78 family)
MPTKNEQQIRNIARDLRKRLGIDHRYSPDLYEVLHRLHKALPKFKLKEVEDNDLPNAEAKAHCETGILEVPKSVLVALDKYGDPRSRWTAAHEIGHIALDHPGRLFRKRPDEPISEKQQLFETEADIFASEFLSPSHLAMEFSTVDEIARRFQLSNDAATRRVKELELEKTRAKILRARRHESQPVGQEKSGRTFASVSSRLPAIVPSAEVRFRGFAAMAYNEETNRLYFEILKPAIEAAGVVCVRGDEIPSTDTFANDILRAIAASHLVVAEISGFNPNVMHEIGLAQSLGKPTLLLCQASYRENEIPSNIRHIRRIMYGNDVGSGPVLRRRLVETLESVLRYLKF